MAENWSEEELGAAVDAYVEMRKKQLDGIPVKKSEYYNSLSSRFGRTSKSYEYRMQNISYVYSLMGREWLHGLKPAKNVGTNVIAILEKLIQKAEAQSLGENAEFESEVKAYLRKPISVQPSGVAAPEKVYSSFTQYARDPRVKAWILQQAEGKCEACQQLAPFKLEDGSAYLEVHHVRRLADGGSDTVENTVALCPNCHRAIHYAAERHKLIEKLYSSIVRLVRE